MTSQIEEPLRAERVDSKRLDRAPRVADGACRTREMVDPLEPVPHQPRGKRFGHVRDLDPCPGDVRESVEMLPPTRAQVVDHHDIVARRE